MRAEISLGNFCHQPKIKDNNAVLLTTPPFIYLFSLFFFSPYFYFYFHIVHQFLTFLLNFFFLFVLDIFILHFTFSNQGIYFTHRCPHMPTWVILLFFSHLLLNSKRNPWAWVSFRLVRQALWLWACFT
jgi:hypothetical protein